MRTSDSLKKTGKFLLDLIELYIPIAAFSVLFIAFMIQIVCRYFFKPLIWPEELSLICFVWVALLGGLYAKRSDAHVAFSMVYDTLSPRTKTIFRLAGNALLFLAFAIALYPSFSFVAFMGYKHSDALKISMTVAYAPFVVFLVDILVRLFLDLKKDLRILQEGEAE